MFVSSTENESLEKPKPNISKNDMHMNSLHPITGTYFKICLLSDILEKKEHSGSGSRQWDLYVWILRIIMVPGKSTTVQSLM